MGWGEHEKPDRPPPPKPSERELRMERALRLVRKVLTTDAHMVADAVTVIDNALEV